MTEIQYSPRSKYLNHLKREEYIFNMFVLRKVLEMDYANVLTNLSSIKNLGKFDGIKTTFFENISSLTNDESIEQNGKGKFDLIAFQIKTQTRQISNPNERWYIDNLSIEENYDKYLDLLNDDGKLIILAGGEFMSINSSSLEFEVFDEAGYPSQSIFDLFPYNKFWTNCIKKVETVCEFSNSNDKSNFIVCLSNMEKEGMVYVSEEFSVMPSCFLSFTEKAIASNTIKKNRFINPDAEIRESKLVENLNAFANNFLDFSEINSGPNLNLALSESYQNLDFTNQFELNDLKKYGFYESTIKSFFSKYGPYKSVDPVIEDHTDFFGRDISLDFIHNIISYSNFTRFLMLVEKPAYFIMHSHHPIFKGTLEGDIDFLWMEKANVQSGKNISIKNIVCDLYIDSILSAQTIMLDSGTNMELCNYSFLEEEYHFYNDKNYDFIYLDLDLIEGNKKKDYIDHVLSNNIDQSGTVVIKFESSTIIEGYLIGFYNLINELIHHNGSFIIFLSLEQSDKMKILNTTASNLKPYLAYKTSRPIKKPDFSDDDLTSFWTLFDSAKFNSNDNSGEVLQHLKEIKETGEKTHKEVKNIRKNTNVLLSIEKIKASCDEEKVDGCIDKIIALIENQYKFNNIKSFDKLVKKWFDFWNSLEPLSKKFMSQSEFIYQSIESSKFEDYSPYVLYSCRALEYELLQKIFIKFHQYLDSNYPDKNKLFEYDSEKVKAKTIKDIESGMMKSFKDKILKNSPKYTLGDMRLILNLLPTKVKPKVSERYKALFALQEFNKFINDKIGEIPTVLIEKIELIISDYRNPSAHVGTIGKGKADSFRENYKELMNELIGLIDK